MSRPSHRRLLLALVVVALALQIAGFHDLRHDDAFITFRYGQNLALGRGLVFNPGEHIMGSTSPGEALISALVYALAGLQHTPSVMSALGCVGWSAQAVALWWLLAPALGERIALGVCGGVLAGAAVSWSWVALETNTAVALALIALVAAERARWSLAAALCGFAALMRPDTLLPTALLGLRALYETRALGLRGMLRALSRPAAVFSSIVAPWLIFAALWFGAIAPRSLRAKLQRASFGEYTAHMLDHFGDALLGTRETLLVLGVLAFAAYGARTLIARQRSLCYFVAYGVLHIVAYAILRSVAGHDWHLYPAVMVLAVLAIAGLLCAIERLARPLGTRTAGALVLGAGLVLALGYAARTAQGAREHATERWNGARDGAYRSLGQYMQPRTQPGELFASVEVGTLAFYTQLPAFDIGMLVTDRKQRPRGHIRWVVLDDAFLGLAPDWPAIGEADAKAFRAQLYEVPVGTSYFDILHAKLAAARAAAR